MPLVSPRIPHLFPRKALARMLASTYAAASRLDEEEAHERLLQALAAPGVLDDLHGGISRAVERKLGPRTPLDRLLDRISQGVERKGSRLRAAELTPQVAAVVVRLDLEVGVAAETMRATLATPRGAAALQEGLAALGGFLVGELTRK